MTKELGRRTNLICRSDNPNVCASRYRIDRSRRLGVRKNNIQSSLHKSAGLLKYMGETGWKSGEYSWKRSKGWSTQFGSLDGPPVKSSTNATCLVPHLEIRGSVSNTFGYDHPWLPSKELVALDKRFRQGRLQLAWAPSSRWKDYGTILAFSVPPKAGGLLLARDGGAKTCTASLLRYTPDHEGNVTTWLDRRLASPVTTVTIRPAEMRGVQRL